MSLTQLINDYEAARAEFKTKAQAAMKESFKEVFDLFPEITAIRWVQYTPYFNDGETCEFSVHEPVVTNLEGDDLADVTHYGEYDGEREDVYAEYGSAPRDAEFFCVTNVTGTHYRTNAPRAPAIFDDRPVKDMDKLTSLLAQLQSGALEDLMKDTFGDHVVVTATRDGFDIDEHDHD